MDGKGLQINEYHLLPFLQLVQHLKIFPKQMTGSIYKAVQARHAPVNRFIISN